MTISRRFYSDLVLFSLFFSVFFCICCALVDSLIRFWVFLELCGLSIIPCFFCWQWSSVRGFYNSLLTYIIMSGLSSVLLVRGVLFSGLYYFVFGGFVLKFGLFPFRFWVYRVFRGSKWVFIFFLSVVLKFPVLFFCFLFQKANLGIVLGDCALTVLMCGFFIWFFTFSWEFLWCHLSLSSVATLVAACFCTDVWLCFFIYGYYFVWALLCVVYFNEVGRDYWTFSTEFWVFCFLLLVTPLSLPLFYKLGVCLALFYSSFYLLFVWCVYRFSEQFFLYKLASDRFYGGVYNCWIV